VSGRRLHFPAGQRRRRSHQTDARRVAAEPSLL
jgi:hypothetical protein